MRYVFVAVVWNGEICKFDIAGVMYEVSPAAEPSRNASGGDPVPELSEVRSFWRWQRLVCEYVAGRDLDASKKF